MSEEQQGGAAANRLDTVYRSTRRLAHFLHPAT